MTKPTAVYSTRTDLRVIAALVEYLHSQGLKPRSISEAHRLGIEAFVQLLQSRGLVRTYASTSLAKAFLEDTNLFETLSDRNRASLMKQMQLETLELEGMNPDYIQVKGKRTISSDQFEAAKSLLKEKVDERTGGEILGARPGEIKKKD